MNFFRIKIGESQESFRTLTLPLEKDNIMSILTLPYGSNKMRYQYPEVFRYDLEGTLLTVTKDPRKVSGVSTSLFTASGWNLDLHCSCIPYPVPWLTSESIENVLPLSYGDVYINEPIKTSYKYGILVPTFGRYEYTKRSLESLRDSVLPKGETLLIIMDESLTKDVDMDKRNTNEYLKSFNMDGISMIQIHKKKHGNMFESLLVGLDLIYNRCEYVMNLDSDTIHKPGWLDGVMQTDAEARRDHPGKIIVCTGYDSNQHRVVEQGNYRIKDCLGGCHMSFRSSDYVEFLRCTLISSKWDTNLSYQVSRLGGKLICTVPSVIQHIGVDSSVRSEKNGDQSTDY